MFRFNIVQDFRDQVADPSCFCNGRILCFTDDPKTISLAPNCGARHECPLFRQPKTPTAKPFVPGLAQDPSLGCCAFNCLRDYERDQQRWIVTMAGREIDVRAETATSAAIQALRELQGRGFAVDKSTLISKNYTVRQA